MYRRTYVMSSRVDSMKWLGILQLIIGLLIFIITIVLAAIDFNDFLEDFSKEIYGVRVNGPSKESDGRDFFETFPTASFVYILVPLTAIAIATGVSGSIMSRYEGLQYNLSARHILLTMSTLNGFVSLSYLIFGGMITFELADAGFLSAEDNDVVASMALLIVIYVLVFFDMFSAFICVAVCAFWNPPSEPEKSAPPPPIVSERIVEEKPYRARDYHRSRDVYSDGYYGGNSRTLPALKYY